MNVGELPHAGGEVDGSPVVGYFDLAPGPMHVEEHEQVGRAIALVLAVIALELARLGRDRQADPPMSCVGLSSKQTTGRIGSGASA